MSTNSKHTILRHPDIPWAELRVSADTDVCYRPHSHAQYSLGVVDSGHAIFHHPDGPQQVRAGTVVLIEPDVVHACNPLPGQIWSYRMLFVDAVWLHQAVARIWGHTTPLACLAFASRCHEDAAMVHMVNHLCQYFASGVAASALDKVLASWVADQTRACESGTFDKAPPELLPALVAMHSECDGRVTVGGLADACGMSHTQFIRRFQAALGATPGAYLQNLRVNGARRLLSQGMALAETAHVMGFADQAHMQRAFKAHHAMTPGDYRNASSRMP